MESDLTGSTNLIEYHNLQHSFNKFCFGKKLKESLSSFLPNLPGLVDLPPAGQGDTLSLRSLIERPPVVNKELVPLDQTALTGFRLHPGPLPEQCRPAFLFGGSTSRSSSGSSSKKKHKKESKKEKKNKTGGTSSSSSSKSKKKKSKNDGNIKSSDPLSSSKSGKKKGPRDSK